MHKIGTVLIGPILIFIGIILLWIQISIESISAILITGILLIILGTFDVVSFFFDLKKDMNEEIEISNKNGYNSKIEIKKFQGRRKEEKSLIVCSLCGEEYPSDTIHNKCIACGNPL